MPLLPPGSYRKTHGIIRRGTRASQPAANTVLEGTLYFVTDELKTERSNGTSWDSYTDGGSNTTIQNIFLGQDGEDGIDGFPGIQGLTGATGPAGANGINGLMGPPGLDGEDGNDLWSPPNNLLCGIPDQLLSANIPRINGTNAFTGANSFSTILNLLVGQIQFPATQNASGAANVFDDFERGSWTPVIGGETSESGQSYLVQNGRYFKFAAFIWAYAFVVFAGTAGAKGTITGNVVIKGLPFTVANISNLFALSPCVWDSLTTNWVAIVPYVNPNTTQAKLRGAATAATSSNTALQASDLSDSTQLMVAFGYGATS